MSVGWCACNGIFAVFLTPSAELLDDVLILAISSPHQTSRLEDTTEEVDGTLANRTSASATQHPITALAPFVPKVVLSSIRADGARYSVLAGVDGLHGLAAASRNMQPSMVGRQAAVMVADVKGFTQLTELLSKRGR